MFVICESPWRLGNRLTLFAHVLGAAFERGVGVVHLDFQQYERYFPQVRKRVVVRKTSSRSPLRAIGRWSGRRSLRALARRIPVPALSAVGAHVLTARTPEEWIDLDRSPARKLELLFGYFFRAPESLARHADSVRSVLRPDDRHARGVRQAIGEARRRGDQLVGVHVRHGDYRDFRAGAFYIPLSHYKRFLEQAAELFGSRTVFLVCSDEPLDLESLAQPRIVPGPGTEIEDLYALAECDVILGPPSSFSRWASFYGRVPLCAVLPTTTEIGPDDFRLDQPEPWQGEVGSR